MQLFDYGDLFYVTTYRNEDNKFEVAIINKSGGNATFLSYTTSDYIYAILVYDIDGPCQDYETIENEDKRSTGYVTDSTIDDVFSDEDLQEDWYRVFSDNGDAMPTSPPGVGHCGAYFPVWLNGTLPDDNDGNVTRTACVQTVKDICEQTIQIEIRKCVGYYLYYLQNTTTNSSYCFGSGQVACPSGLSSDSGFYPGCSSSFPAEMISVSVQPVLIEGDLLSIPGYDPSPSLIPVFRCRMDTVPHGTYFYDVHWYINGNVVSSIKNVAFTDINSTDLNHTSWIDTYKMNMEPVQYEYTVIEGEYVNIEFKSTVPVGCYASHHALRSKCSQAFYIFQPEKKNKVATCSNNVAIRDITFNAKFCGISVESIDWWEKRTLKVYGYNDGLYNSHDRTTYIKVSTSSISTFNDMWANLKMQDITVTVLDKDAALTNRLCQSYNDPHLTTFDGKYYDYMAVGEFVMYRNDEGPYWVHALYTNCVDGWVGASCHCGIAIRSRNSLLIVRTCQKISRKRTYLLPRPMIKLLRCDVSDLLITQNGPNYKVKLPIGTEIRFSVSRWGFITMISVKPSVFDLNRAKGLCGIPGTTSDTSDDFTDPDGNLQNEVKAFGDSWRVTSSSEQLFIDEPEFLGDISFDNGLESTNNTINYCVCEKEAGSSDFFDNFNTVQCNLTSSTEYCTGSSDSSDDSKAFYSSCSTGGRRRRSAGFKHEIYRRSTNENEEDDQEFTLLEYDDDFSDNNTVGNLTFRNGWTEEKAREKCEDVILKTFPVDIFSDFTDFENDGFIESCVTDIKMAGDTSFLKDTVQAIATKIIIEVEKNETFYTTKTENGSQTVLEYLTSFLCPSNCSDNGNCTSGLCVCYEGYIGDDCSEQISTPPSDISLPFNGLCTLGTRFCKRANIYGNFASTKVWYKLMSFQINESLYRNSDAQIFKAEYRNAFMVTVDLLVLGAKPPPVGYEISLSNDGLNFGDIVTLIVYDETCYNCNQPPVSCQDLSTCPYTTKKTTNSSDTEMLLLIGVSVGVTIFLILLVISVVYLKSKYANRQKIDSLKKQTYSSDQQGASSEIWATSRQASISDFGFNFDSITRPATPVELFMPNINQKHYDISRKTKFDPDRLKGKMED